MFEPHFLFMYFGGMVTGIGLSVLIYILILLRES